MSCSNWRRSTPTGRLGTQWQCRAYSDINLQIFSDNAKEVELFLLNRKIDYRHLPAPSERATLNIAFTAMTPGHRHGLS